MMIKESSESLKNNINGNVDYYMKLVKFRNKSISGNSFEIYYR